MSMSQEEIEALMNESADLAPAVENIPEVEDVADDTPMSEEDIAALVASSDETVIEEKVVDENIDDILAGIDGITEDSKDDISKKESDNIDKTEDMDDILAGIEGITEDEPVDSTLSAKQNANMQDMMNQQIDQGIYPMPVEKEHKVVNQLNEVAEDSEEKASQIFDVLSYILDENSEIQQFTKNINEFIKKQTSLLEALNTKFPQLSVVSENLEMAKNIAPMVDNITTKLDAENNQIFSAMDLMQFHDINRQKIERVMAVIKKLSNYLNGIFEDDSNKPEVQIAKHISGDASNTVDADDIESLIAEFNN